MTRWGQGSDAATTSTTTSGLQDDCGDDFDASGARIMTRRMLQRVCKARADYMTAACVTTLYLQDLKFRKVDNMQVRLRLGPAQAAAHHARCAACMLTGCGDRHRGHALH